MIVHDALDLVRGRTSPPGRGELAGCFQSRHGTARVAQSSAIAEPGYRTSFLEAVPENARTLALARAWLGEPAPSA